MLKLKDPSLFKQQAYVAGAWVDADDGKTVAVTNPATGEQIGTVPVCGAAETERAIKAADVAQRAWAQVSAKERSASSSVMFRASNLRFLASIYSFCSSWMRLR